MEIITEKKERQIIVPVIGMTCAACASSVESVLSQQQGVLECVVNFANESVQIAFDPYQTTPENLKKIAPSGWL